MYEKCVEGGELNKSVQERSMLYFRLLLYSDRVV